MIQTLLTHFTSSEELLFAKEHIAAPTCADRGTYNGREYAIVAHILPHILDWTPQKEFELQNCTNLPKSVPRPQFSFGKSGPNYSIFG